MPCYHPITAYYAKECGPTGKRALVFKPEASLSGMGFKIGCGRCVGCRLERSRQWAMRCMHEARVWSGNHFLTLTYDDEHVPADGSVRKRELQLFMKRLRKSRGAGVRFFGCGEYGGLTGRPHYHVLVFNCDLPDLVLIKKGSRQLFSSEILSGCWEFGFSCVGEVTFESCSYVARYIVAKINGDLAEEHYQGREPEFALMSRRPGLGTGWYEKYGEETHNLDSVVMRGREMLPPRFYDGKLKVSDAERLEGIKRERKRKALARRADATVDRLRVREQVTLRNLARLKRDGE